jgi:hypothetical protein
MILDILTVLFFVAGLVLILFIISERRRDVLHYVTKRTEHGFRARTKSEGDDKMYGPVPSLPDETLIEIVRFLTILRSALMSSGLNRVRQARHRTSSCYASLISRIGPMVGSKGLR